MITLANNQISKEDMFDLKINNFYYVYKDDSFKLCKLISVQKEGIEYCCVNPKYHAETKQFIFTEEDKVLTTKDKALFSYYDISQLNPCITYLSNIHRISYAALLYNFKFRAYSGVHYVKAGKLTIGVDIFRTIPYKYLLPISRRKAIKDNELNYATLKETKDIVGDIFKGIKSDMCQTLVINGNASTGILFSKIKGKTIYLEL